MRYWSPKLRSVTPGEWLQFDGSRRIAVIREVEVGTPAKQLLRAETWADDPTGRDFIGYFPVDALRLAAETVWELYQTATAARTEDQPMPKPDSGTKWHPLMNAVERTPGVWTLVDSTGREYGAVRIIREGGALVYVSELRGEVLGGRNVRMREAVEKVHAAYVRSFNDTPVRARRP